jgi:hypothetical protein
VGRGYGFKDEDDEEAPRASGSAAPRASGSATSAPAAKASFAAAFDEDDEVDDEAVVAETAAPVAAPAPTEETPLPKKTIVKKVIAKK